MPRTDKRLERVKEFQATWSVNGDFEEIVSSLILKIETMGSLIENKDNKLISVKSGSNLLCRLGNAVALQEYPVKIDIMLSGVDPNSISMLVKCKDDLWFRNHKTVRIRKGARSILESILKFRFQEICKDLGAPMNVVITESENSTFI